MENPAFWVYILLCENGNYYTGYTNNLKKRYEEHLAGTAKCKYTRSFKPLKIAQSWPIHGEKSEAMRLERYIKTLSRPEKERLILNPNLLFADKSSCSSRSSSLI